jgi:hypothetical protein
MSRRIPSQGMVADKRPRATRVVDPDGKAILRGIGRAVNAKQAALDKPRPPQKVGGRQDWKKG